MHNNFITLILYTKKTFLIRLETFVYYSLWSLTGKLFQGRKLFCVCFHGFHWTAKFNLWNCSSSRQFPGTLDEKQNFPYICWTAKVSCPKKSFSLYILYLVDLVQCEPHTCTHSLTTNDYTHLVWASNKCSIIMQESQRGRGWMWFGRCWVVHYT